MQAQRYHVAPRWRIFCRRIACCIAALCAFPPLLGADMATLRTLDGKSYHGEVFLEPGNTVSATLKEGAKISVPLTDVAAATFTTPLSSMAGFGPLAEGWTNVDVGEASMSGMAGQSNRTVAVRVASGDVGGKADSFHFVHFRAHGDLEVVARVISIAGADRAARVGLMIRDSLKPDAKFAWVAVDADGAVTTQERLEAGGSATLKSAAGQAPLPCWLKLVLRERQLTLSRSGDGKEWVQIHGAAITLKEACLSGIAIAAHGGLNLCTAFLDGISRTVHGVRGEYFAGTDFAKPITNRFDTMVNFVWNGQQLPQGLDMNSFSVRWTGELVPVYTENYVFHVDADDEARLWLDGQELPPTPFRIDRLKAAGPQPLLKAGDRYPFKIEYKQTGPAGYVRLGWSSQSQGKETIPARRLFCTIESRADPGSARPTNAPVMGRGIMLRTGTFIAATVRALTEHAVRFTYRGETEYSVPSHQVARVVVRVSPRNALLSQPGHPAGALLANGDFVEGEVKLAGGRSAKVSSVLLGLRHYNIDDNNLAALVFGDPAPGAAARYELRLADHSVFMAKSINVEADEVTIEEPVAGTFRVPRDSVTRIRAGKLAARPDRH